VVVDVVVVPCSTSDLAYCYTFSPCGIQQHIVLDGVSDPPRGMGDSRGHTPSQNMQLSLDLQEKNKIYYFTR